MKHLIVTTAGVAAFVSGSLIRACQGLDAASAASLYRCGEVGGVLSQAAGHAHCSGCTLQEAGLLAVLVGLSLPAARSLKALATKRA